jgi:hypothetical protein
VKRYRDNYRKGLGFAIRYTTSSNPCESLKGGYVKRSEMIVRLEKEFGLDCEGQPGAEDILSFIEKNGMLPPNVCWSATGEFGPVKEIVALAESDYDCSIQWEDE